MVNSLSLSDLLEPLTSVSVNVVLLAVEKASDWLCLIRAASVRLGWVTRAVL